MTVTENTPPNTLGLDLELRLEDIGCKDTDGLGNGSGDGKVNGIMTTVKIAGNSDKRHVSLPETILIEPPLFIDSEHPASLELDLAVDANPAFGSPAYGTWKLID